MLGPMRTSRFHWPTVAVPFVRTTREAAPSTSGTGVTPPREKPPCESLNLNPPLNAATTVGRYWAVMDEGRMNVPAGSTDPGMRLNRRREESIATIQTPVLVCLLDKPLPPRGEIGAVAFVVTGTVVGGRRVVVVIVVIGGRVVEVDAVGGGVRFVVVTDVGVDRLVGVADHRSHTPARPRASG